MRSFHNIKPDKTFVARTQAAFLSVFREKYPAIQRAPISGFKYFVRGFASGVALLLLVSGASVYADQSNVGAQNVLYPLKRSQEAINLAFSKEADRPVLHLKYAKRRLDEMTEVEHVNPQSAQIVSLAKDLREEVSSSLEVMSDGKNESDVISATREIKKQGAVAPGSPKAEFASDAQPQLTVVASATTNADVPREKKVEKEDGSSYCHSLNELLKSKSRDVREVISQRENFFEKFQKKCFPFIREDEMRDVETMHQIQDQSQNILEQQEDGDVAPSREDATDGRGGEKDDKR